MPCADVSKPDYGKVHADALQRMRDVLKLPKANWEVRYAKHDIEISIQRVDASSYYLIRSTCRVPLPVAKTHAHYTVRRHARAIASHQVLIKAPCCYPVAFCVVQNTQHWRRWAPDAAFNEVERVDASRAVLHCCYKIPVISNRACTHLPPGSLCAHAMSEPRR